MTVPRYLTLPVLTGLSMGFMHMNIPPVAGQFMELFGIRHGGLSILMSALFWTHSLCQVPAGLLIDRLGALQGLIFSFSLSFLGLVVPLFAPENMTLAIAMRMVLGISTTFTFLASLKALVLMAPAAHVPRAQGIQGAAYCLGTILPYIILPRFGETGWYWSYILSALFTGLALASLIGLPRAVLAAPGRKRDARAVWGVLTTIFRVKALWALGIFHGIAFGAMNNVGNWLPTILADLEGHARIGQWAAATSILLLIGTAARAFGGELLRWISRTNLIGFSLLGIAVFFLIMGASNAVWISYGAGMALVLCSGFTYGTLFSLTSRIMPPAHTATAVGFMNMMANIANIAIILVLGQGREFLGSFSLSFLVLGLLTLLCTAFGIRILKREPAAGGQ
jgi:MFS family permease